MGVPKFYRWLSVRYPKISQRYSNIPTDELILEHFHSDDNDNDDDTDNNDNIDNDNDSIDTTNETIVAETTTQSTAKGNNKNKNKKTKSKNNNTNNEKEWYVTDVENDILSLCAMAPPIDRLYIDLNGIIHGCSHAQDGNTTDTGTGSTIQESQSQSQSSSQSSVSNSSNKVSSLQDIENKIFQRICYYIDRLIIEIVQPTELVYIAIDGSSPRAKLNQQRARRYRSDSKNIIQQTIYHAHLQHLQNQYLLSKQNQQQQQNQDNQDDDESQQESSSLSFIQETVPGRFAGKFNTTTTVTDITSLIDTTNTEGGSTSSVDGTSSSNRINTNSINEFHSNCITPGTEFFFNLTKYVNNFIQQRINSNHEKYKNLTIIFSDCNDPGEGEHKIMQFMRSQQYQYKQQNQQSQKSENQKQNTNNDFDSSFDFDNNTTSTTTFSNGNKKKNKYHPNTSHCIVGQDGDLIMLGLATHEPNLVLLRELVLFDNNRKQRQALVGELKSSTNSSTNSSNSNSTNSSTNSSNSNSTSTSSVTTDTTGTTNVETNTDKILQLYIYNSRFEFLHMNVLRDYIAYEFECLLSQSSVADNDNDNDNDDSTKKQRKNSQTKYDIEHCIDDFIFLTFLIGNDFLPHMPALDIKDDAFDLLFYTYRQQRKQWLQDELLLQKQEILAEQEQDQQADQDDVTTNKHKKKSKRKLLPYLTNGGTIVSGKRLEIFFAAIGAYEEAYFSNKKTKEERIRDKEKSMYNNDSIDTITNDDEKKEKKTHDLLKESLELQNKQKFYQHLLTASTRIKLEQQEANQTTTTTTGSITTFNPVLFKKNILMNNYNDDNDNDDDDDDDDYIVEEEAAYILKDDTKLLTNEIIEVDNIEIDLPHSSDDDDDDIDDTIVSAEVFDEIECKELLERTGQLLQASLVNTSTIIRSPTSASDPTTTTAAAAAGTGTDEASTLLFDVNDVKGRYYSDKFNFNPLDYDKHLHLRKEYLRGLIWNLKYYYEGCPNWDWYYPYYYGPMVSDLTNVDEMLQEIQLADKNNTSKPLQPFQQLLACLPPTQSHYLPEPYRKLMTSTESPISDFYPTTVTIDMNGKRWPWEAVVLLPFIDTQRLLDATAAIAATAELTENEIKRNTFGSARVFTSKGIDNTNNDTITKLNNNMNEKSGFNCIPFEESEYYNKPVSLTQDTNDNTVTTTTAVVSTSSGTKPCFRPELVKGVQVPLPGFTTLRDGNVYGVYRRRLQLNIHGSNSHYRTSCLELNNAMPEVFQIEQLTPFIGDIVYINYPHFIESYVTAISNSEGIIRGKPSLLLPEEQQQKSSQSSSSQLQLKKWTAIETMYRKERIGSMLKSYVVGERLVGSGGIALSEGMATMLELDVMLHVRPIEKLKTLPDGQVVKVYSTNEVFVPLFVTGWIPSKPDPRLHGVPMLLERDPFLNKINDKVDRIVAPFRTSGIISGLASRTTSGITGSTNTNTNTSTNTPGTTASISGHFSRWKSTTDQRSSFHTYVVVPNTNKSIATTSIIASPLLATSSTFGYTSNQLVLRHFSTSLFNRTTKEHCVSRRLLLSTSMLPNSSHLHKKVRCITSSDNKYTTTKRHNYNQIKIPSTTSMFVNEPIPNRRRLLASSTKSRTALGIFAVVSFFYSMNKVSAAASIFGVHDTFETVPSLYNSNAHMSGLSPLRTSDGYDNIVPKMESSSGMVPEYRSTPTLDFFHGTTTVSFVCKDCIVTAVDSRASLGNFVGSKTTNKVLPINSHILGTMAGGAADCMYWINKLQSEAKLYELQEGRRMSVARVSRLLSNVLYENRRLGLSIGTMIMGYDDNNNNDSPPKLYYVDNSGIRVEGTMFAVGSGSTYALGILDTDYNPNMSIDEAIELGIRAIRYATFRDSSSGGYINVYVTNRTTGWELVFSDDLDNTTN